MVDARLIACEKTGRWATALRRVLSSSGIRVYETRSLPECWNELSQFPNSLLVLEVTPKNLEDVVRRLSQLGRSFPRARAIACADAAPRRLTRLLREAGVVHAVSSWRELPRTARIIRRHIEHHTQDHDPLQLIRDRLPWSI